MSRASGHGLCAVEHVCSDEKWQRLSPRGDGQVSSDNSLFLRQQVRRVCRLIHNVIFVALDAPQTTAVLPRASWATPSGSWRASWRWQPMARARTRWPLAAKARGSLRSRGACAPAYATRRVGCVLFRRASLYSSLRTATTSMPLETRAHVRGLVHELTTCTSSAGGPWLCNRRTAAHESSYQIQSCSL